MRRPPLSNNYLNFISKARVLEKARMVKDMIGDGLQTPFMILDLKEAEKAIGYFERYLPRVFVYYAMKSNSHSSILELIKSKKMGLDAASAFELDLGKKMGFSSSEMIVTNPHKSQDLLSKMAQFQVRASSVDSIEELRSIAAFARETRGFQPKCLIRIRPILKQFSRAGDPVVQVNLSEKFGVEPDDVNSLVREAIELGVELVGLSYHIGSNCYRVSNYLENAQNASMLMSKINLEYNLKMKVINIGGGFPNKSEEANGVDDLDDFYKVLGKGLDGLPKKYEIWSEPGRGIAGPTGIHVSTVVGMKTLKGKRWLILDDGVYGSFGCVYQDKAKLVFFPAEKRSFDKNIPLDSFTLGGPTCDSFDTISTEVMLPKDIKIGDQIFVLDMGAYTLEICSRFNGFQGPQVVVEPVASSEVKVA